MKGISKTTVRACSPLLSPGQLMLCSLLAAACAGAPPTTAEPLENLKLPPVARRPWRFRQFPIIAWWGPPGTARRQDFQAYKEAGFTLYAANPDEGYERAMELARQSGLSVMAYRRAQGFGLPPAPADFSRHREQIVGWLTHDEPSGTEGVTESITAVNTMSPAAQRASLSPSRP